jgi:hypothetical protein
MPAGWSLILIPPEFHGRSSSLLTFIASDWVYHEVIRHDAAAELGRRWASSVSPVNIPAWLDA